MASTESVPFRNVRPYLKLIGTVRGVVLGVAAELPKRRPPELADIQAIFG
jgi:hypothetical protein